MWLMRYEHFNNETSYDKNRIVCHPMSHPTCRTKIAYDMSHPTCRTKIVPCVTGISIFLLQNYLKSYFWTPS